MSDWNSGRLSLPMDEIEKIDYTFPNTTVTCLPLTAIISRYYSKNGNKKKALELIKDNLHITPQLGINEFEIAKQYFLDKKYDSAYKYSKIAYEKLPFNAIHFGFYTEIIAKNKDSLSLEKLFKNKIKTSNNPQFWASYLVARFKIFDSNDSIFRTRTKWASKRFNFPLIDKINEIVTLGDTSVSDYNLMLTDAENLFNTKNYNEAIEIYKKLEIISPNDYTHLENQAICLFMLDKNKEALEKFQKALKNFTLKDGKSKFYIGVIYNLLNDPRACDYLSQSLIDGYVQSKRYYLKLCS